MFRVLPPFSPYIKRLESNKAADVNNPITITASTSISQPTNWLRNQSPGCIQTKPLTFTVYYCIMSWVTVGAYVCILIAPCSCLEQTEVNQAVSCSLVTLKPWAQTASTAKMPNSLTLQLWHFNGFNMDTLWLREHHIFPYSNRDGPQSCLPSPRLLGQAWSFMQQIDLYSNSTASATSARLWVSKQSSSDLCFLIHWTCTWTWKIETPINNPSMVEQKAKAYSEQYPYVKEMSAILSRFLRRYHVFFAEHLGEKEVPISKTKTLRNVFHIMII